MHDDPLFAEPTRPIVDKRGRLENPLGAPPFHKLADTEPLPYEALVPSATYVSPGFEYLTDQNALPARVRGALRFVPVEHRVRHDSIQRAAGHLSQAVDVEHHGGHIVAVSLGGFASGPNLFPQAANFNVGAFARLERSWRQALAEGCTVEVDIALTFDERDPTKPQEVLVTHWEDGAEELLVLLNEGQAQ